MSRSGRTAPALSPVLLLGFTLRPAPRRALQAAASLAMAALLRGHRGVFERLEGLANPVFLIDPVDLPFRFHLCTALPSPRLLVLGEDDEEPGGLVAAAIQGPLPVLIDPLEGRIDWDALFFSRALTVEGDMAAVVAMRNAVDGADISLVEDLLRAGGALYRRAERDLETLRAGPGCPRAAALQRAGGAIARPRQNHRRHARPPPGAPTVTGRALELVCPAC